MMAHRLIKTIAVLLIAALALSAGIISLLYEQKEIFGETYQFSSASSGEDPVFLAGYETLAIKNETVYVILDTRGAVLDQRIVNRIYDLDDPEAAFVVDYGRYISVDNMISVENPILEEERVLWESSLLGDEGLYYEGIIDKQLPVSIDISYFLNGEEIDPAKLAGKNGRLDIVIQSKNNLSYSEPVSYLDYEGNQVYVDDINYVPFLVQGTLEVDLNRFSNIETEDGINVVMGQSASINFMTFPYPEAEITISMDGKDIELERITFIVSPRLPPLPELDIEDELVQMLEGMAILNKGLRELAFGADQIQKGLGRFQDESRRMVSETEDMALLIKDFREQSDRYKLLVSEADLDGIAESMNSFKNLLDAVEEIPDPAAITGRIDDLSTSTAGLNKQLRDLNKGIAGLESSGEPIRDSAKNMIEENEPGTELYDLGKTLLEREEQIDNLLSSRDLAAREMADLTLAVEKLQQEWSEDFIPGLQALEQLTAFMNGEPGKMLDQIFALSGELARIEDYFNQIDSALQEAEGMLDNLALLPGALNELVSGQTELRDGLIALRESGIFAIEKGLIDGINESRFGKAKIALMHELADDYRSYADNEHNRFSEVQFIMQTSKIEADRSGLEEMTTATEDENQHWSSGLWARFTNLFE